MAFSTAYLVVTSKNQLLASASWSSIMAPSSDFTSLSLATHSHLKINRCFYIRHPPICGDRSQNIACS